MAINLSELKNGIWYNPYMKVYSLGLQDRIGEISSYPRAYLDTIDHSYISDVSFIVTKADFNLVLDTGENVFYDGTLRKAFRVGEQAVHRAGDALPGEFPLWIESESLPFTPVDKRTYRFELVKEVLLGLAKVIIEEGYLKKDTGLAMVDASILNNFKTQLSSGLLTISKAVKDNDKQIIYLKYKRIFK